MADGLRNRGAMAPHVTASPIVDEIRRKLNRPEQSALKMGARQTAALGHNAVGAIGGALGFDEFSADRAEAARQLNEQAAAFRPDVMDVDDVRDVGTAIEFAKNNAIAQLPNVAALIATRGLAGKGAKVAGATKRATDITKNVGTGVGGVGLGAGEAQGNLQDADSDLTPQERSQLALATGAVTGSLEALPVVGLLNKLGLGKAAKNTVQKSLGRRVSEGVASQAATEGATEASQEAINKAVLNFAEDNAELLSADDLRDIRNAAITGATVGGVFGGVSGMVPQNRLEQRMADLEADDELTTLRDGSTEIKALKELGQAPETYRTANVIESYMDRSPEELGVSREEFRGHIVPVIRDIATGVNDVPNLKAVEAQLRENFPFFDEMVESVRRIEGSKRADEDQVEDLESTAAELTEDEEQLDAASVEAGAFGKGDEFGQVQEIEAEKANFLLKDGEPFRSQRLNDFVAGKKLGKTSVEKRAEKLNADPDSPFEHNVVPFTQVLEQQVEAEGFTGPDKREQMHQRATVMVEEIVAADPRLEKPLARVKGNPIEFLKRGFSAVEKTSRTVAARENELEFSPEVLQRSASGIVRAPRKFTPAQLDAKRAGKDVKPTPHARDGEVLAKDPSGATVSINLQALISQAMRQTQTRKDTQGRKVEGTQSQAEALATGLSSLVSQGFDVDLANLDGNTVAFTRAGTKEKILVSDLLQPAALKRLHKMARRAERSERELPSMIAGAVDKTTQLAQRGGNQAQIADLMRRSQAAQERLAKMGEVRAGLNVVIQGETARQRQDAKAAADNRRKEDFDPTDITRVGEQGVLERGPAEDDKRTVVRDETGEQIPTPATGKPGIEARFEALTAKRGRIEQAAQSLTHLDPTSTGKDLARAEQIYQDVVGVPAKDVHTVGDIEVRLEQWLNAFPTIVQQMNREQVVEKPVGETLEHKPILKAAKSITGDEFMMDVIDLMSAEDPAQVERNNELVQEWAEGLGVEGNFRVIGTEEMVNTIEDVDLVTPFLSGKQKGVSIITPSKGEVLIYVSPRLKGLGHLETLAHEMGHGIYQMHFQNLGTDDKRAVVEAFMAWRDQHGTGSDVREVLKGKSTIAMFQQAFGRTDKQVDQLTREERDYLFDLEEWFADQTARWLTSNEKPVTAVDKFFHDIAQTIKRLWETLAGKRYVESNVEGYLDNLWTSQARYEGETVVRYSRDIPGNPSAAAAAATTVGEDLRAAMHDLLQGDTLKRAERRVLGRAFNTAHVRRQVREHFQDDRIARQRLDNEVSGSVAAIEYGYVLWARGELDLGPQARSVLEKVKDRAADALGFIQTHDQATELLTAMRNNQLAQRPPHGGFEMATARRETTLQHVAQTAAKGWQAIKPVVAALTYIADERMRDTQNPALIAIADHFRSVPGEKGVAETMHAARQRNIGRFAARMNRIITEDDTPEFAAEVLELLQQPQKKSPSGKQTRARKLIRKLLDDIRQYMVDAKVQVGKIDDYFPWVFDSSQLMDRPDDWVALVSQEKYEPALREFVFSNGEERDPNTPLTQEERDNAARRIAASIIEAGGYSDLNLDKVSHTPRNDAVNQRSLDFLRRLGDAKDREALAGFFSKDLGQTMMSYIEQATKRTEYTRRFGPDDQLLTQMLNQAERLGASEAELSTAHDYIHAQMGSLGAGINPKLHKIQSWVMVYQNVRLLGLSLISNLIDPIGIAVRSGDMGVAFEAYKAGIQDIIASVKGDKTALRELGEDLGTIERHMVNEALGWEYGGVYMTGAAKKINEAFFRFNGMSGFNRLTRVMALRGAERFIVKHATRPTGQHSARFLEELALSTDDVKIDTDGNLVILPRQEVARLTGIARSEKVSKKQAEAAEREVRRNQRIETALNRFVDQSILRPDASVRPIWASDPHFMLVFHLKSFIFAFHHTILERAFKELERGNFAPVAYLSLFVPAALGADVLRQGIKGAFDDEDDEGMYRGDWTAADWISHGAQRSGVAGVGELWSSAFFDSPSGGNALMPPALEQASDLAKAVFSEEGGLDRELAKALPLQTVLRPWFL